MKISPTPIVIIGLLISAYPAATWITGSRIEKKFDGLTKFTQDLPNVKLVKNEFHHGLFSSSEDMVLEFVPQPKAPDTASPAASDEKAKPFQLHIIHHIKNGPFANFSFGAGTVDTELVFDDKTKAELEKVFGKQVPLQIHTTLNYDGGATTALSSPPVNTKPDDSDTTIDWKGVKATVAYSEGVRDLHVKLDAPGLTVHGKDKGDFIVGPIALISDSKRAAPESMLYLGKSTFSIDQVKYSSTVPVAKTAELQKIVLESNADSSGDFFNTGIKIGAQKLVANQAEFGPVHFDYGIRHIHQASMMQLLDAMNKQSKNPQQGADPLQAMSEPWKKYGSTILKNQPELDIDRVSLASSEGEAKVTAKVSLADVDDTMIDKPAQLMSKVVASATVTIPEALLTKLVQSNTADPDMQATIQAGLQQQVTLFEQQGYIISANQMLTATLEFKDGQTMINGKPLGGFGH